MRSYRVCYWNTDARVIDSDRMRLEQHLAKIGDVTVETVRNLEDAAGRPCDLLVVAAQSVPAKDFGVWIKGFKGRMLRQGAIWLPALILADAPFDVLRDILLEAARDNWYFDILAPDHIASLPIRVANLLRVHDHLHELHRYASTLDEINARVATLESELHTLRGGAS